MRFFSYGKLMAPEQLSWAIGFGFSEAVGLEKTVGFGHLTGWKITPGPQAAFYDTLVPAEGGRVDGVVYELTPAEMKRVDRFEGVDVGFYRRETVTLDDNTQAVVYLQNGRGER